MYTASIHPIQVEVDFPSNHLKNRVPILDVRVWIEKVKDTPVTFVTRLV